jgi:uncharacterized protein
MSSARRVTGDSFINLAADLGIGASNVASGGTYNFAPVTRNRVLIEWCYRGSWIARKTVDCRADDMVRQGTRINDDMPPDRIEKIQQFWQRKRIWQRLNETLKWARLYGGCLAVIVIEGQKLSEPLRLKTVGKGSFKGLIVLDRWMVTPDFSHLVSDPGSPDYGDPQFYDVVADARTLPQMRIHHSRCLRFDGLALPYWQKIAENGWNLSVLEPLWDRLLAFDSATQGAAQLVYRAHLRTVKLPKFRENVAAGGKSYRAVVKQLHMIRLMQSNEGLTVLDAEDTFESQQYAFGGLADMMAQFGMQLSGAADTPLTRMFGQSPGGMNSTGDSDLENYRDSLKSSQVTDLAEPIQTLYELTHRSLYGEDLPDEFGWEFSPLGQLKDQDKASITGTITSAVVQAYEAQLLSAFAAAKELRQLSRITGVFSNLTDEDLQELKDHPPGAGELDDGGEPPDPALAASPAGEEPADDAALPEPHHERVGALAAASRPAVPQAQRVGELANVSRVARLAPEQPTGRAPAVLAALAAGARTEKVAALAARSRTRRVAKIASRLSDPPAEDDQATEPFPLGLQNRTRDTYPVHDFHGLRLVIETLKGERRTGNGWTVNLPAAYGYVGGTSSAEGPREQYDCFVGENLAAPTVWLVEQVDPRTKAYDEGKLLIGFDSKAEAIAAYQGAFSDGLGAARTGKVRELAAAELPSYLARWHYSEAPPRVSRAQQSGTEKIPPIAGA